MASAAQQAAITTRHKYEQRCPDCGSSDFVDDFSAGDLICRVRQLKCCSALNPGRCKTLRCNGLVLAQQSSWVQDVPRRTTFNLVISFPC